MGNLQRPLQQSTQLQRLSFPVWSIDSVKRKEVIEEAFSWIGTPFHHQARLKGIGCDCIGLDIGIARIFSFDKIVNFTDYKNYRKSPDGSTMTKLLTKYHEKILLREMLPGDWFHFSFIQFPQHVAMLVYDGCIIHSHQPDGKVIHHKLNKWWLNRIAGCYRYRGIY